MEKRYTLVIRILIVGKLYTESCIHEDRTKTYEAKLNEIFKISLDPVDRIDPGLFYFKGNNKNLTKDPIRFDRTKTSEVGAE